MSRALPEKNLIHALYSVVTRVTKNTSQSWLCVKAVTEPDSADSTEITDRALAESTEYNGKLRFSDTGI